MRNDKPSDDNQVDENLRRVFAPTLSEELPDRFKDLLQRLRDGEAEDKTDSGSDT